MTDVTTDIPAYGTPLIDPAGNINEVWFRFLLTLLTRTGGMQGEDITQVINEVNNTFVSIQATQLADVPISTGGQNGGDCSPLAVPVTLEASEDGTDQSKVSNHGQHQDPGLHALATPQLDGFMSAVDKAKINSLSLPTVLPVSITADVVTANTTADGPILSISLPADSMSAGSSLEIKLFGVISSAAIAGTLSVWVKVGATKVLTQTFTLPGGGSTNASVFYTASATVRTAGAGGTIALSSQMSSGLNVLSAGPIGGSGSGSINTTVSNTLTVGWNWSVANAGNTAAAKNAIITLEKA